MIKRLFKRARREPTPLPMPHPSEGSLEIYPVRSKEEMEEARWERRRWELVRYLVAQDRRSVVLGKRQASPKTIARKARELADATITELRTNKHNYNGTENDNTAL